LDLIYVTVTPYATIDGTGAPGPAVSTQVRMLSDPGEHAPDTGLRPRAQPLDDGKYALRTPIADGSTNTSEMFNAQGTILPVPADASIFSYAVGGGTTGHMFAVLSTSATYGLRRPDGSVLNAPATNAYTRPAAPTLAQVAGGALGARTLFVRVAYVKKNPQGNAGIMYRTSAESSLAVLANNLLVVRAPVAVPGYDGWVVLCGTATGAEVIQQRLGGGGAVFDGVLAFGADWTEPVGGAQSSSTLRTPYDPSMDSGFTISERAASPTIYKGYLYFDAAVDAGIFRMAAMANGGWPTALSEEPAQEQNGDRNVALSFGATVSITMPVAGGSGSGTGSGGKFK
jgi:hypothetical protein